MKRNSIIAGVVMSLAGVLALCSCKKEEIKVANVPTVKLEVVEETLTSVSFRITATNASEVAYVEQDDLSAVPSARAILTAGKKVSAAETQEITIKECTPGETYYFAAAAVSESGEYSEVATIELTAAGTDCSFEFTINTTTDEAIVYTVKPTDDNVSYVVSVLPAATFGESSDDEIFEAIVNKIAKSAEESGETMAEYIESISHKGAYDDGKVLNLTAETAYLLVAVGIESDGSQSSLLAKETVSTTATEPEMTFEMSVSDITSYSAHISVKPSSGNSNYVYLCQPAINYPVVNVDTPELGQMFKVTDQAEANKAADAYIASVGYLLDQKMGLYQGSYDLTMDDLASDTRYFYFAFAYEPRLGRQSDCQMWVFTTKHGYTPGEFDATIDIKTTTSTTVVIDVTPKDEGMYGTYWGAFAFPTADYTVEAAQDAVTDMLEAHVDQQHEAGIKGYTIQDAVQSILYNGVEEFLLIENLTPGTDYTLVLVPVYIDGTFAENDNVVTTTFKTNSDSAGGPAATVDLIGYYDADAVYEANIFSDMPQPSQAGAYYIAAFKVSLAEKAELCRYLVTEGSNYESEDAQICEYDTYTEMTDDQFLTMYGAPSWKEIPAGNYETETTAYIFVLEPYYDADTFTNPWIFGAKHTLIVMAQNESGVWGTSGRKFFYISSYREGYSWNNIFNVEEKGQVLSPVSDLVDLVNNLNEGVL